METKKISFYGFLDIQIARAISILKERFTIQQCPCSEGDYLFIGPFADINKCPLRKNQIRIYYTGEPVTPPIEIVDYAIGFDYLSFLGIDGKDRYLNNKYALRKMYDYKEAECWKGLPKEKATRILQEKTGFCNFIYGHASPNGERELLFNKISEYKRVDSIGTFLNNMKSSFTISRDDYNQKINFIKKYKFTIACESIQRPGFCTEKIGHAFVANTIPIYFGDPFVEELFNPKSFINANNYKSLDDLLDYIKYLDNNDDEYIKMLCEPKLIEKNSIDITQKHFKEFLFYILEQNINYARRRCIYYGDRALEQLITRSFASKETLFKRAIDRLKIITNKLFRTK